MGPSFSMTLTQKNITANKWVAQEEAH